MAEIIKKSIFVGILSSEIVASWKRRVGFVRLAGNH
jgi:hypothetical protein